MRRHIGGHLARAAQRIAIHIQRADAVVVGGLRLHRAIQPGGVARLCGAQAHIRAFELVSAVDRIAGSARIGPGQLHIAGFGAQLQVIDAGALRGNADRAKGVHIDIATMAAVGAVSTHHADLQLVAQAAVGHLQVHIDKGRGHPFAALVDRGVEHAAGLVGKGKVVVQRLALGQILDLDKKVGLARGFMPRVLQHGGVAEAHMQLAIARVAVGFGDHAFLADLVDVCAVVIVIDLGREIALARQHQLRRTRVKAAIHHGHLLHPTATEADIGHLERWCAGQTRVQAKALGPARHGLVFKIAIDKDGVRITARAQAQHQQQAQGPAAQTAPAALALQPQHANQQGTHRQQAQRQPSQGGNGRKRPHRRVDGGRCAVVGQQRIGQLRRHGHGIDQRPPGLRHNAGHIDGDGGAHGHLGWHTDIRALPGRCTAYGTAPCATGPAHLVHTRGHEVFQPRCADCRRAMVDDYQLEGQLAARQHVGRAGGFKHGQIGLRTRCRADADLHDAVIVGRIGVHGIGVCRRHRGAVCQHPVCRRLARHRHHHLVASARRHLGIHPQLVAGARRCIAGGQALGLANPLHIGQRRRHRAAQGHTTACCLTEVTDYHLELHQLAPLVLGVGDGLRNGVIHLRAGIRGRTFKHIKLRKMLARRCQVILCSTGIVLVAQHQPHAEFLPGCQLPR